jgi:hypothetical protein
LSTMASLVTADEYWRFRLGRTRTGQRRALIAIFLDTHRAPCIRTLSL